MKSRAAVLSAALLGGCAAPATHPAGGPYCFVGYASYTTAPQFVGITRLEAASLEAEGNSFLVAYFDESGHRKQLLECRKGVCRGQNDSAAAHLMAIDCPLAPVQRAVDAR